jgi:hypothetical protein
MTMRHPLFALVVLALASWIGLLFFGKLVRPSGWLIPILFLLLLFIALTASFAPIAQLVGTYLTHSKWYYQRRWQHALRQGALVALAIVTNLALLALDAWFWADVILIVLVIVLVELIVLARK